MTEFLATFVQSALAKMEEFVEDLTCFQDFEYEDLFENSGRNLLLVAWILCSVFVVIFAKHFWQRFATNSAEAAARNENGSGDKENEVPNKTATPPAVTEKKLSSSPIITTYKPPSAVSSSPNTCSAPKLPVVINPAPKPPTPVPATPTPSSSGVSSNQSESTEPVVPVPVVKSTDPEGAQWINDVFQWVWNNRFPLADDVTVKWISNLNRIARESSIENGLQVAFSQMAADSLAPMFNSPTVSVDNNDNMSMSSVVEFTRMGFEVHASGQKNDQKWDTVYDVTVVGLKGRIKISCYTKDQRFLMKFEGWPLVKLALTAAEKSEILTTADESALKDVVEDIVTTALATADIEVHLGRYYNCPRFQRARTVAEPNKPVHYDSMQQPATTNHKQVSNKTMPKPPSIRVSNNNDDPSPPSPLEVNLPPKSSPTRKEASRGPVAPTVSARPRVEAPPPPKTVTTKPKGKDIDLAGKRLLVKIIKAGLGLNKECHDPFCVVELDEPVQRYQTTVARETETPFWDEHFLFELDRSSCELLFEIYDSANRTEADSFLGVGVITVQDLLQRPHQSRHTIKLHPRPFDEEVYEEFEPEDAGTVTVEFSFVEAVAVKLAPSEETIGPPPVPPPRIKVQSPSDQLMNGSSDKYHDLDARQRAVPSESNKNKLVMQNIQKPISYTDPDFESELRAGLRDETYNGPPSVSESIRSSELNQQLDDLPYDDSNLEIEQTAGDPDSFMDTLKRKLGSGRPGRPAKRGESNGRQPRSISAERSRPWFGGDSREPSSPRSASSMGDRTSMHSNITGASSITYLHDASALIVECVENGIMKHYLVPSSLVNNRAWRKKGVKLHVFNDHLFIAKHISGSQLCQVCNKAIPRRLGKQGYECRDCLIKCHKACHVKVPTLCPNSSTSALEITYVQDPKELQEQLNRITKAKIN